MEQSDLLKLVCGLLERLGVRYLVTESQATIAFGEPRFTNDIDVVADLSAGRLDAFCAAFPPPEFYLSLPAASEAVAQRGTFNIIHPGSGLKVDVIIPSLTSYTELRFRRAVRIAIDAEFRADFISPEDIIVQKLQWHQIGGGERHLRDVAGVVKMCGASLDRQYVEEQSHQLGVGDLWRAVLDGIE